MTAYFIFALVATTLVTAVILRFLIPVLKSKKMGQKILDIGPRWHKQKEGTPTMGGISFIIAFFAVCILLFVIAGVNGRDFDVPLIVITALFALFNGLIGIIDDRTKFSKGENEGLLSWQKYLLQLAICVVYLFVMGYFGYITTEMYIPFVKKTVELGIIYYPIAIILITGVVNSVNLTDGIDGLASSETAVVSAFFALTAFTVGSFSLSVFAGAAIGCCIGFLCYNFYPAKIFMGDTGSLFLGGLVIGMAFMANNPLIIVIVGIMYIVESLSDIIQVGYFKLSHGKRVFKMAPIHHHFEKCGWSEIKIVTVFSAIDLIAGAAAYIFDIM